MATSNLTSSSYPTLHNQLIKIRSLKTTTNLVQSSFIEDRENRLIIHAVKGHGDLNNYPPTTSIRDSSKTRGNGNVKTFPNISNRNGDNQNNYNDRSGFSKLKIRFTDKCLLVDRFINDLLDYKYADKMSDDLALNTLSSVLSGEAARVCSDYKTWGDAIQGLRQYGQRRTVKRVLEGIAGLNMNGDTKDFREMMTAWNHYKVYLEEISREQLLVGMFMNILPQTIAEMLQLTDAFTLEQVEDSAHGLFQILGKKNKTNKNNKRDMEFPNLPKRSNKYVCKFCKTKGWSHTFCPYCNSPTHAKHTSLDMQ